MRKPSSTFFGALLLAGVLGLCPDPAPAQTSAPVPAGLVSWWRGEDNASDSQGGNNGNLLGGVTFAPGMVGQAFSLDGYSGYIRVPASPSLPSGNAPRTVMLWMYTRPSSWAVDRHTIFHSGYSFSDLQSFSLDMADYPQVQFYTWGNDLQCDAGVPVEGWVHAAVTYDGSTARLYTQGQLRGAMPYGALNTGLADIQIGTLDWLSSYFDGLIDEVALFDRALDQTEIQAIFNAGSAGMSPNSPPEVSAAAPSISSIWPPNHQLVPITINGVTDPDGDAVSITITSISNNETGTADASGIGTSTAQVAATRFGKGTGRTYTISFTAADGKGGTTSGSVTVVVPHHSPKGELADDDQDDDHGDKGKKDDDKDKDKDKGKKDDDKNKKSAGKTPAKRSKPTAVENATWGEVKNSQQ